MRRIQFRENGRLGLEFEEKQKWEKFNWIMNKTHCIFFFSSFEIYSKIKIRLSNVLSSDLCGSMLIFEKG